MSAAHSTLSTTYTALSLKISVWILLNLLLPKQTSPQVLQSFQRPQEGKETL